MQLGRLMLLFSMIALPAAAAAQEKPPAMVMRSQMTLALYPCELNVSSLARQAQNYGIASDAQVQEQIQCIAKGRAELKDAYEKFIASGPTDEAKSSAKLLYAANLAWADAIAAARSRAQLDNSVERAELRKAEAMFEIDAGL